MAGETGGVLESLLDKLAVYKEKTQAIKKKVKTALTYPISIVVVAVVLIFVMMRWVLPALKRFTPIWGAELPRYDTNSHEYFRLFCGIWLDHDYCSNWHWIWCI